MDSSGEEFLRHCSYCMKNFVDSVSARQHFESRTHKRKEAAVKQAASGKTEEIASNFTCYVCNVTCNSAKSLDNHKASRRHRNMVLKHDLSAETGNGDFQATNTVNWEDNGNMAMDDDASKRKQFGEALSGQQYDFDGEQGYCYVCNIDLTSVEQAIKHLNGAKHRDACSSLASEETEDKLPKACLDYSENPRPMQHGSPNQVPKALWEDSENPRPMPNTSSSDNDDILYCKLCDFRAESLYTIIVHLKSVEHDTNVVNRSFNLFMSCSGLELGRKMRGNNSLMNAVFSSLNGSESLQRQSASQENIPSGTAKHKWEVDHKSEGFKDMSKLQNIPDDFRFRNLDNASLLNEESVVAYRTAEKIGKAEKQLASKDSKMKGHLIDCNENQNHEACPLKMHEYENADIALKNEGPEFTFDMVTNKGHCFICDVDLSSKHVMDQHLNGRKHKNNKFTKQTEPLEGVVYEMQTSDLPNHTMSDVSEEQLGEAVETIPGVYICELCDIDCKSENSYNEHCLGQKHRKKLAKLLAEEENAKTNLTYCVICEVECCSEENYGEHVLGQKHRKKVTKFQGRKPGVLLCDFCNVECYSENNLIQHLKGVKHRKSVLKAEQSILFCSVCRVECPCEDIYMEHLQGEKHRNKMIKFQTDALDVYYCDVCAVEYDGENKFLQHLLDVKHTVNLKQDENNAPDVIRCQLCNVECHDEASYQQHVLGGKHRKKFAEIEQIAQGNVFFCALCDFECISEKTYDQHAMDIAHRKEVERYETEMAGLFFCDVCNVECFGENNLMQHLLGEKHRKRMTTFDIERSSIFFCHVCNIDCTEENNYNRHLFGKNHKKTISKYEDGRPDVFYCVVCQVDVEGEDNFRLHIAGEDHRERAYQLACEYETGNTKLDTQEELSDNQSTDQLESFENVPVMKSETFDNKQSAVEDKSELECKSDSASSTLVKIDMFDKIQNVMEDDEDVNTDLDRESSSASNALVKNETFDKIQTVLKNEGEVFNIDLKSKKKSASVLAKKETFDEIQPILNDEDGVLNSDIKSKSDSANNTLMRREVFDEVQKIMDGETEDMNSDLDSNNALLKTEAFDDKQASMDKLDEDIITGLDKIQAASEEGIGKNDIGLESKSNLVCKAYVKTEILDEVQIAMDIESGVVNTDFEKNSNAASSVQVKKEMWDNIQTAMEYVSGVLNDGIERNSDSVIKDIMKETFDEIENAMNDESGVVGNAATKAFLKSEIFDKIQFAMHNENGSANTDPESNNALLKRETFDGIQTTMEDEHGIINMDLERNTKVAISGHALSTEEMSDKFAANNGTLVVNNVLNGESDSASNTHAKKKMIDKMQTALVDESKVLNTDLEHNNKSATYSNAPFMETADERKTAMDDVRGVKNKCLESENNSASNHDNSHRPFRVGPEDGLFQESHSGQKDSGSAENDNMSAG